MRKRYYELSFMNNTEYLRSPDMSPLSDVRILLSRYLAEGNQKALDLLKRISPVAWQHIHFLGHYAFRDMKNPINLEAILASVNFL